MAYTRLHWVESETPLSADNMNNIEDGIEELQSQKVDKVSGKGLSDQNYTATEKTKLAGIEEGAQVNPGVATSSTDGLMSASDKASLDRKPDIKIQGSSVTDDELNIVFSSPLTVTKEQTAVIGRTTTTETIGIANATTSAAGLMSAADKTKLNGIEAEATKNTIRKESVSLGASKTVRARSSTSLSFTGNFPTLCALAAIEFTNSNGVAVKDIAVCGFHVGTSGSQTIATVEVYNLSTSDITLHATYTRVRLICFS